MLENDTQRCVLYLLEAQGLVEERAVLTNTIEKRHAAKWENHQQKEMRENMRGRDLGREDRRTYLSCTWNDG